MQKMIITLILSLSLPCFANQVNIKITQLGEDCRSTDQTREVNRINNSNPTIHLFIHRSSKAELKRTGLKQLASMNLSIQGRMMDFDWDSLSRSFRSMPKNAIVNQNIVLDPLSSTFYDHRIDFLAKTITLSDTYISANQGKADSRVCTLYFDFSSKEDAFVFTRAQIYHLAHGQ
jgi:hypothetical protein